MGYTHIAFSVGSKEKVTANALEDGIFVAGKKFYKWGDVRVLDF